MRGGLVVSRPLAFLHLRSTTSHCCCGPSVLRRPANVSLGLAPQRCRRVVRHWRSRQQRAKLLPSFNRNLTGRLRRHATAGRGMRLTSNVRRHPPAQFVSEVAMATARQLGESKCQSTAAGASTLVAIACAGPSHRLAALRPDSAVVKHSLSPARFGQQSWGCARSAHRRARCQSPKPFNTLLRIVGCLRLPAMRTLAVPSNHSVEPTVHGKPWPAAHLGR